MFRQNYITHTHDSTKHWDNKENFGLTRAFEKSLG